jgi:hypothetical protein
MYRYIYISSTSHDIIHEVLVVSEDADLPLGGLPERPLHTCVLLPTIEPEPDAAGLRERERTAANPAQSLDPN